MVRPKRKRRIAQCPKQKYFNQQDNNPSPSIKLNIDEFEAIRLREYHEIKQKESAELMGISQSTFHRILISARKKIAISLIEGRKIKVIGDDFMNEQIKYKCNKCGFQWINPEKKYEECPNCKSKDIEKIEFDLTGEKSFGVAGRGRFSESSSQKCKCPNCEHEEDKIRGIPCRNKTCPECGTPLIGLGRCFNE